MTTDYYRESRIYSKRCTEVRNYVKFNPNVSNEQIANGLGLKIQTVTPRIKELRENGVVWVTGRTKTSSKRPAWTYKLAACPSCRSNSLGIKKMDQIRFSYHCNNCHRDFIALVGDKKTQEVFLI
ncbi:MAG: winged helix-turn-helix domain-containing protein [Candidatus Methanomethylophilaceae archaeon]|nr:winged helix-turn-helix domain-containing protein [Candidatus Methanomethylophilaceae archaeon]MBQ9690186.1 winged helix-turn-helix domain-containing protein [Candidatus Methanomethylophilaceae archaeon]